MKIAPIALRILEAAVLGGLFVLGFGLPGLWGGFLEVLLAVLLPVLLLESVLRGRPLGWTWLALFLGLAFNFRWVPHTLATKGGLPPAAAWVGGALIWAYEALGFLGIAALVRRFHRRSGVPGAVAGAALGILAWEALAFHIYPWTWGSALGALPWTARSAAFLGTFGLSALIWACGAAAAAALARGAGLQRILAGPAILALALLALPLAWKALPRDRARGLDIAMVQPNWESGVRRPGMEAELWRRSDALLAQHHLPRAGQPTLLLWPESSILGENHLAPDPRLAEEARRRGLAWLFGTEGGAPGSRYLLYNLVRGEVAGRPSFTQAKTEPMAFGERMPGPAPVRRWLDGKMGFVSQEPGELTAQSVFVIPNVPEWPEPFDSVGITEPVDLRVHPLLCSEALLPLRVRLGVGLTGADLLTNHTNDGWFDESRATDLHGTQIRLRAVEMGLPLVRTTLTGKSGLFREDGSGGLWGRPMSEAAHAFELRWRPIRTPARSPWLFPSLLILAALGALAAWARPLEASR